MLVGICGERKQRFHFGNNFDPVAHLRAPAAAPGFGCETGLHGVKKRKFRGTAELTVAAVSPKNNSRQSAKRVRRGARGRFQLRNMIL